jgi:hypothetical protein
MPFAGRLQKVEPPEFNSYQIIELSNHHIRKGCYISDPNIPEMQKMIYNAGSIIYECSDNIIYNSCKTKKNHNRQAYTHVRLHIIGCEGSPAYLLSF